MSAIEKVHAAIEEAVTDIYHYYQGSLADYHDDLEFVTTESFGSGRWTEHLLDIYSVDGEFVGVEYERGLTEMQENSDLNDVAVKLVEPYEFTETRYRTKK